MYRDEFKNLPLSDRFMFGEVMRNSGICKLFLEELLQCKIERIVFAAKEADLSDTVLGHGIRLDVFLADENNTHYDVEMQNTSDSIEKRSRYYQSVIDRELLDGEYISGHPCFSTSTIRLKAAGEFYHLHLQF